MSVWCGRVEGREGKGREWPGKIGTNPNPNPNRPERGCPKPLLV